MTHLMQRVINRLRALPEQKQNPMARFILQRLDAEGHGGEEKATTMSPEYREHLKQVGVWTEEDLQPLKDAESLWKWQAPQWS